MYPYKKFNQTCACRSSRWVVCLLIFFTIRVYDVCSSESATLHRQNCISAQSTPSNYSMDRFRYKSERADTHGRLF